MNAFKTPHPELMVGNTATKTAVIKGATVTENTGVTKRIIFAVM